MDEVKDKNADGVVDAGEAAPAMMGGADGYYGEDLDMNGDLDLSFLDDEKDEPRDRETND
ncbi:hypothetical protein FWG76_00715 [Candidatus Saccharibacteria bacterium]|nr:hypothetical protein [Candidatus Saccharibacteria bacterium]